MIMPQIILATVTASEELPDSWHWIALAAFVLAAVFSLVLLVAAFVVQNRVIWFGPTAAFALLAGSLALGFSAYVYKIDDVALRPSGTEGASTIGQSLGIPALPVLASLAALVIYRIRKNKTR